MKLGFLTAPFPETPLMEVADWAAEAEFEVLEIACWPMSGGVKRKYAGTAHIDVANLTDAQAGEIKAEDVGLLTPDEKLCVGCHNEESPTYKEFKYKEAWAQIEHKVPAAE